MGHRRTESVQARYGQFGRAPQFPRLSTRQYARIVDSWVRPGESLARGTAGGREASRALARIAIAASSPILRLGQLVQLRTPVDGSRAVALARGDGPILAVVDLISPPLHVGHPCRRARAAAH